MAIQRLRRVVPTGPGITRRRTGRGFTYWDAQGTRLTDPETLERIRQLVIPPAWTDVWICPDSRGHLQVRGADQRGRWQYIYHERWRIRRDLLKFNHMLEFAEALPGLRQVVSRDLANGKDMNRDRVLACAIRLLELGCFRIGGEGYAEDNQTFGLATVLKSHVRLAHGSTVVFDYVAKSGKRRVQSVVDEDVFAIVQTLKRRRGGGPELLAYRRGKEWVDVRSCDINAYLKQATGADFSAKDFRTWAATVLAAVTLSLSGEAAFGRARQRVISQTVKEVARYLGNTPAVARSSYIDPRVIDRYEAGHTIAPAIEQMGMSLQRHHSELQGDVERAVIALLGEESKQEQLSA